MGADSNFDEYCRGYLGQWEQRATVRHLTRTRLTAETARSDMFPAAMQPLIAHAEVAARGDDTRHRILARATATFQLHVAILEVDLITDLCIRLVNKGAGVAIPESARQVVLTVATDESYHAFVAREFLSDLERLTGIIPNADADMPILRGLAALRDAAPTEIERAVETMALCFAENFVTEELFGLSREQVPEGPFHTLMREHMMDEGRHQIFFRRLFRHLWESLDETRRTELGRLVPIYLDGFLSGSGYEASQRDQLEYAGFDRDASGRIVQEALIAAFGTERPRKSKLKFMRNALNLIEVSGILAHQPTRQTLIESGWVDA